MRRAIEIVVSAILGAVVAVVGAIAHRSIPPLGVILSIALVLAAMIFVRTWGGWIGVLAFAVPFVILTIVFSRPGPGGSLLVAGDGLGYSWLWGGSAAVIVACLLPPRLLGASKAPALTPAAGEGEATSVQGP
ncbi:hypothetical protein [Demequina sp.]|uniref:hypothetical protein n=1 Tax=Demequina sp. TaxID=2050685 RepID=UPI003D11E76A